MNAANLTPAQSQALLDLTMLAMYADGHLAAAEDERIGRLLASLGFDDEVDRAKHYDASVSRISRHSATRDAARAHAIQLARQFTTPEHRRVVISLLDDMVTSDRNLAAKEGTFLAVVREALQMP